MSNKEGSKTPAGQAAVLRNSGDAASADNAAGGAAAGRPAAHRNPRRRSGLIGHNENQKERQQKAKEDREIRRTKLKDPVCKYLIARAAFFFAVDPAEAEEQVLDSEIEVQTLLCFVKGKEDTTSAGAIVIVAQEGRHPPFEECGRPLKTNEKATRMRACKPGTFDLTGAAIVVTKRVAGMELFDKTVTEDISFNLLDVAGTQSVLAAIKWQITNVMQHALKDRDWSASMVKEKIIDPNVGRQLLLRTENYVDFLAATERCLQSVLYLKEIDLTTILAPSANAGASAAGGGGKDELSVSSTMAEIAKNPVALAKIEEEVRNWSKQIELVLAAAEQMRREADDTGPLAEIDYWRNQNAKFSLLVEQMRAKDKLKAMAILQTAKSKLQKHWLVLDRRVHDASIEATDNLAHLSMLKRFFEPLYSKDPVGISDSLPSLMHAIRMINTMSRYYNTSERITALLIKITNQMVTACKNYLTENGMARLWQQDPKALSVKLKQCIALRNKYQKSFEEARQESERDAQEIRRPLECSVMYIFGKFDTFCRRLSQVSDMLDTFEKFSTLQKCRIQGIDAFVTKYTQIVNSTKKKPYNPLDHRKNDFEHDYEETKRQFRELEQQLQLFMDHVFTKCTSTMQAIALLESFKRLGLHCLNIRNKLYGVYLYFAEDIEDLKRRFVREHEKPPISAGLPPVSGACDWARYMLRRIAQPMEYFENFPYLMKTVEGEKAYNNYVIFRKILSLYEQRYYESWAEHLAYVKPAMKATVFVRKVTGDRSGGGGGGGETAEEDFVVNFDPWLYQVMKETEFFLRLQYQVAGDVKRLHVEQMKYKFFWKKLSYVLERNRAIRAKIPHVWLPLLRPRIRRIDKALRRGLTDFTWDSLVLDKYIGKCEEELDDFDHLVQLVLNIKEKRIDFILSEISEKNFCALPSEKPWSVREFADNVKDYTERVAKEMDTLSVNLEDAVNELIKSLIDASGTKMDYRMWDTLPWIGGAAANKEGGQGANANLASSTQQQTAAAAAAATVQQKQESAVQQPAAAAAASPQTADAQQHHAPSTSSGGAQTTTPSSSSGPATGGGGQQPQHDELERRMVEEGATVYTQYSHKLFDAVLRATRNSLERLRKGVFFVSMTAAPTTAAGGGAKKAGANAQPNTATTAVAAGGSGDGADDIAFFTAEAVLNANDVAVEPTFDELQMAINRGGQNILDISKNIPLWGQARVPRVERSMKAHERTLYELPRKFRKDSNQQEQYTVIKNHYKNIVEHKDVTKIVQILATAMRAVQDRTEEQLNMFRKFNFLWIHEKDAKIHEFVEQHPTLGDFRERYRYFTNVMVEVEALPHKLRISCLEVVTSPLIKALVAESKMWMMHFGKSLNEVYRKKLLEISEFLSEQKKKLKRKPDDLEDIRLLMQSLAEIREREIDIDMGIEPTEEAYVIMQLFGLTIDRDELEAVDSLRYNYEKMQEDAKRVQESLGAVEGVKHQELHENLKRFDTEVNDFMNFYQNRGPMEENITPTEANDRLNISQTQFDDLWRKYITYTGGQELFGEEKSEYNDLLKTKKQLNLLQKLYGLYSEVMRKIDGYADIPWDELNLDLINADLGDFQNRCKKLPSGMKDWQAYKDLKKKIDDFLELVPLLEAMSNKAMKDRHWERIANVTGHNKFEVAEDNAVILLRDILQANLLKYKEEIEDICISATKEKDIEAKLKQVIADWSVQLFKFSNFKTRGELLLKGNETGEVVALLEDSLMVLGSLLSNRYNAPFRKDIQLWIQKLSNTSDIIENWLIVQNLWVYLEAVFVGGDIAKQLPKEAKRFSNIDKSYVKIMERARQLPNVVQCCTGDNTLSELLPHLLEQLELCQKSLTGYLEAKRLVFPRFFFVSDPVLLEILGQASDSHTIQPHLLSIFENVAEVKFHEKDYDRIIAVRSKEGEEVPLENDVMARGNVEMWLGDLLREQQTALHGVIREAFLAISGAEFSLMPFVDRFVAQVGLLGIQMIWTRDAENALRACRVDRRIMQKTNKDFLDMLNKLIDQTTKDLSKFERIKYETLITIHVHQRDIFDEICRNGKVRSPRDFEWLKQARFYFKDDSDICLVQITDVDFVYQNEFLGCTDRLVITPLTDRCYITLAQALGMSMGGAPAGPAGTGKTETTKDMGKALGKYVVVFNCSDQMDFRGLGRIYKGLAQSGSWGCFDEFNRIELPVLSVAAQQIHVVLTARKEKRREFIFTDGDVVSLNPEFGLFITMNPGYAGRQELPENLKILFRSVAMMVPDRQIIMRVKLASAGFKDNIELAQKFFTLYKLCEEQLSKQIHYDWGLRNILSVLRTLGSQKRARPAETEQTIVMRVLRDMNLSKLVDEDEPLFMSLIQDLFPGIQLDSNTYEQLQAAIQNQCEAAGLINHPPWNLKLVQLYETQLVRHGFMTLGPTGAGKSCCIHVLMKSMTENGTPHREMRMNPKAITASQMFGRLDVATNDWTDGIFSTLWRKTLKTKKGEAVWLVLDGPIERLLVSLHYCFDAGHSIQVGGEVIELIINFRTDAYAPTRHFHLKTTDAVWIENLNSVLDDNKTLTLANGDRITMAPTCKIVFEPDNVDNASPATVSRNGMVFMSSSVMEWDPILEAWLKKRSRAEAETFRNCFARVWDGALDCVRNKLEAKMRVLSCMYVRQCIDLLEGLLAKRDAAFIQNKDNLSKMFVLGLMWSLGGVLELEDRFKLQEFLRESAQDLLPKINNEETIFEFTVDDQGQWTHWRNLVEEYVFPPDRVPAYSTILVPNVDNVRTGWLIDTIARQGKQVLLIGEQGTAKTVMIKASLKSYDPETHASKTLNFSSATLPQTFQRIIESFVDKRMGNTYGPPAGKRMTVFIDDINMPRINEWGDQVTNEIVRQLIESRGFYNLDKPGDFTNIIDIQFISAMIHPGGGRNDIPHRLKRQFNIFNCTLPSNSATDKIFTVIAQGYFGAERFPRHTEVRDLVSKLVPVTRMLWQQVKVKMLPTPAKFHYVFNLRDLSRIWEGMLKVKADECPDVKTLLLLWKHECTRVIADRFVSKEDKVWFEKTLANVVRTSLGDDYPQYVESQQPYFANFLREPPESTGEEDAGAETQEEADYKVYELIPSFPFLKQRLHQYMDEYNEHVRSGKMDLVFFDEAMTSLAKIARVISTPGGHVLLVGVGGSGKQSLTKLASHICGNQVFQITLSRSYNVQNFIDDLKLLMRAAGGASGGRKGKGVSFIFTDNDIKDENFLEYVNNILSGGEVSAIFSREELDEICNELPGIMKKDLDEEWKKKPPTHQNLYEYFSKRVKDNLHVVLCFSPVGEQFRNRSLKFPGLISGCTCNWFQRWPRDALVAVARHFLSSFDISNSNEIKNSLMEAMGIIHDGVAERCKRYFERFRRTTHVTPKSYLSFLAGYKNIYTQKVSRLNDLASRMTIGLEKLQEAAESVKQLEKDLEVKRKELAIAAVESEEVLKSATAKAQATEVIKLSVQKKKDEAQKIKDGIQKEKDYAETKLVEAIPLLEQAESALKTIKPADIGEVKKLANPPIMIQRVMDCVLILFQRPLFPTVYNPEKKLIDASWGEANKLMSGPFLPGLQNFDKDTINEEMVELMEGPYISDPSFNKENAAKASQAAVGLLLWVAAMSKFYWINREVLPLKANLVQQEVKLNKANSQLAEAQGILDEKEHELGLAQAEFAAAMARKKALEDDAAMCERKKNAASTLISMLGGERTRWTEQSKEYRKQIERLVGDVVLCTGFLSYAGPFNQEFRNGLLREWEKELLKWNIPFSESLDVTRELVDDATVEEWNIQGLPNDELSVQNGIITTQAARTPLLIDPQQQAKQWIKRRERDTEMVITSLNHKYFRQHMEDALSLGKPLMLEDVEEKLDPALDNILERNYIKQGSSYKVKFGDKEIDVLPKFRMYITTKLPNPCYTPEIFAKTSIVDFTVTVKGLEDQLLGRVILTEKRELESERTKLMEDVAANKRKQYTLEANLLHKLTSIKGSLVDDPTLIDVLRLNKTTAAEVGEKLIIADETKARINQAREEFRPVACRGSILYFLIVEMSLVNVMYQTSLRQFLNLFDAAMERSEKSPVTQKRVTSIIDYLTYGVFRAACRGLYETHKFLFTLLLALKIDIQRKRVSFDEFQTFIKGGAALDLNSIQEKKPKWVSDMVWLNLVQLSFLPAFGNILQQVQRNDKEWKTWFDKDAPEDAEIPEGYSTSLDDYRKLLLIRSWVPDRTLSQARKYIADALGERFAEPVILNMEDMWAESDIRTPLVCLLSMGSDPTSQIEALSKKKHISCKAISMGQGQEVHARKLMQQCIQGGGWVLLQNCHLGLEFMVEVVDSLSVLEDNACDASFRVWVTTEEHPRFPISMLQLSIKYTNEPPAGMRAGVTRTYGGVSQDMLDIIPTDTWRTMLYGVSFLHSAVQERRKFGPLGWCVPYEFNWADWYASVQFVQAHLDDLDAKAKVNWGTVRYMLGEVQYGGRVTDDYDKRLLNTYAKVWFSEDMFRENFQFAPGYKIPKVRTISQIMDFMEKLPNVDPPTVFGLHTNADITYQANRVRELLDTVLNIQPKDSSTGGGETRESVVKRQAEEMLSKLPAKYVPSDLKRRLEEMGKNESMNIFLRQEIDRMQKVILAVKSTLSDLLLAIDGTIVMNENLRDALDNIFDARVPKLWTRISWLSSTLGFWFSELIERNAQYFTWLWQGRPKAFWMTGFFNPQGFLTAMRQEVTRKNKGWSLDYTYLVNEVTHKFRDDIRDGPKDNIGVYVYGLYLDGAGWDRKNCKVQEQKPKVLFEPLPVVYITAANSKDAPNEKDKKVHQYVCPVYKKPRRTDMFYVTALNLRTTQPPEHWILRGVALLCDIK